MAKGNRPAPSPLAPLEQTAAALSMGAPATADLRFSCSERMCLRQLAEGVSELSFRPMEQHKRELWLTHNDLGRTRPLVFIDPENGWNEIITAGDLECSNALARAWEMRLRKEVFWGSELLDDRVIEAVFDVPFIATDTGWGLREERVATGAPGGAFTWDPPVGDYDRDLPLLHFPEVVVDRERTRACLDLAAELFGKILEVRLHGSWWWTLGLTSDLIMLRGLSAFLMDFYDNPEGVHRLMAFLRDGTLHRLDVLAGQGLLSLNTGGSYVGSGGFGWTAELPAAEYDPGRVGTRDMWGFAESQEAVSVSPAMFEEFIFQYQLPILERFGLNCYGCCEPLDGRWHVVRRVPRLRRVSVSPWADVHVMSEALGAEYLLSLKPSPSPLALPVLDEEAARGELRSKLEATRGNLVEVIMKDNHTLGGNPRNAVRWVEIARQEIGRL